MFVETSVRPLYYGQLLVRKKSLQDYLLFGKPLRASTTKSVLETLRWPRIELGYSNNVEDWAIRMVITYRRLCNMLVYG